LAHPVYFFMSMDELNDDDDDDDDDDDSVYVVFVSRRCPMSLHLPSALHRCLSLLTQYHRGLSLHHSLNT